MSYSQTDKGIITYIYLENFVTYNKVEIKPGRYLNVIIGPNGTGKSTIVCAIVLGLGGKPSTIGRATHVAEYIKAGCTEATIKIHLKGDEQNDIVIKRIFNVNGTSHWFINEKTANMKLVQELTKSMNIQIDNLCQFLPQDKVQDFSKMNARELLENTEKSIGDPNIFEYHQKLISDRNEHKDIEMEIKNKEKLLSSKIQVHDGLKEVVSGIKERKLIKKKIISLKQKKAWMQYDQMRRELLRLKKQKDATVTELKTIEIEIKPIDDMIAKINSEIKILQKSIDEHSNKVSIKNRILEKTMGDIMNCENGIKDCENICKQRIQTEQTRDSEIDTALQQKNKLDNDLSIIIKDIGSEETLLAERDKISAYIEKERNGINALTNKNFSLEQNEQQISFEMKSQETELHSLNIETKRLQLLRERSSDAYKGILWLRENKDKFSAPIHEPMLLSINVKNQYYAKYLENIIPLRDLIAFVCEDKKDMNLLLRYLRDEQNLRVNAVHSDPKKYVSMEPQIHIDNIKQFGFTHYLVSLIDAPNTIMKYLITMYNLQNIPIGTRAVEDNLEHVPRNIYCFFSEKKGYAISISKYSGAKSTRMKLISKTGLLSIVQDKSKLEKIENKLKALQVKKLQIMNKVKEIKEQICQKNKELDKYRAERSNYQQNLQQIQTLKSRISIIKRKIEELQNERTSVEEIRKLCNNEIKALLNKQMKLYKLYNEEMEQYFKCITRNEGIKLALKLQNKSLRTKKENSETLREKLKTMQNTVRQLTTEIQPMKNDVQKMYNEALQTTNGISPTDAKFAPINKTFNKLPPTIEQINKEISVAQAKVFCMGNNVDAENVLHEFEQLEEEINNLKEILEKFNKQLQTASSQIKELQEKWLFLLNQLIETINHNFSSYFTSLNCSGEIALVHGENPMDFYEYGIKIRVKFRDSDQLQELTRYHQSGGERAVTTAIYMLSLQELSRVPFRCVDEINQGMDAINERRVFDLLVKITGKPNSSQYFLLTPKLLPDLQYTETVTVHCVFNGPFVISHTEFDTKEYCKHVVRLMEKENNTN